MLLHRAIACLLIFTLTGCEATYWVRRSELERALVASVPAPTVRGAREDGTEVDLRTTTLVPGPVPSGHRDTVAVKPRNRTRRAGFIVAGVGGLFAIAGALTLGIGLSGKADPPGCHDEGCWLGPLVGGAVLSAFGGSVLVTGLSVAGASGRSVEAR
jgi:hypothetical protein